MEKTTINNLKTLKETKFLTLYDATYHNRKGQEKHWMIASRKAPAVLRATYFEEAKEKTDAVVLVAYHTPTHQLVLVKQMRIPLNDFVYELPAGLLDSEEEIARATKRELREETGLDLISIKNYQDQLYLSPGMTDESVALVYCTCQGELSDAYLEDDETIEPLLVSKADAKALLESHPKIDIKTYLVLQQFIAGVFDNF